MNNTDTNTIEAATKLTFGVRRTKYDDGDDILGLPISSRRRRAIVELVDELEKYKMYDRACKSSPGERMLEALREGRLGHIALLVEEISTLPPPEPHHTDYRTSR